MPRPIATLAMAMLLGGGLLAATQPTAAQPVPMADAEAASGRLVLLLDSSGSMKEAAKGGGTKIEAAKAALRQVSEKLPDEAEVGVRVFGATVFDRSEAGACTDTQNVVPVGPIDRDAIDAAVADYKPYGETPIGAALRGAADDLGPARDGGERAIVLLSDGEPTCAPDPCQVARQLAQQGINVRINVVGLDVDGPARRALQCIAREGNGEYFDASSAAELANSMVKVSVRDVRAFALSGERIEGGLTSEEALPLEPGNYVDTSLPDREARWYAIDKPAGGGLALATMARPTREQGSGRVEIALITPDGQQCTSRLSMTPQILGRSPISAAALVFNEFTTSPNDEECLAAEQLLASVKSDPGDTDYRLQVSTQPAITNADELPEASDPGDMSWVRPQTIPTGAASPVIGGVNYDDAPELTPGEVYSDTLRPGEQLVYKVPVGYGQAAQLTARLGSDPQADDLLGPAGTNTMLVPAGSMGARFSILTEGDLTGSRGYNGARPTVLTGATPAVQVRNVEDPNPAQASNVVDGHHYFILGMAHEGEDDENYAAPVRLMANVHGEVSGEPEYDGEVEAPAADETEEPAEEPTEESAGDEDTDESGAPVLLIAGIVLGAGLIGALAYLLGRRNRS